MSIAWTTVLVIVFLFPGILFHVGLYAWERIPREIVRVGVIGEIAVAVFVSIAVHLLAWLLLGWADVRLDALLATAVALDSSSPTSAATVIGAWGPTCGGYVLASGTFGFLAGLALGWTGVFATHKWARELRSPDVLVTVYVMTKTVIDDKALMYRGGLTEFYLKPDGSISYLVLNGAQKFHMSATDDHWSMTEAHLLFGPDDGEGRAKSWSFLAIDGANIANILFEKSPEIDVTGSGADALNKALEELERSLRRPGS